MFIFGLYSVSYTSGKPEILQVSLITPNACVNRMAEFRVDLRADFNNPFDPDQVSLDLKAKTPSGERIDIPGFLYQSFGRKTGAGTRAIAYASAEALKRGSAKEQTFKDGEILFENGKPEWRIRFTPQEQGDYELTVSLRDRHGSTSKRFPAFNASKNDEGLGFVGIDPFNKRGFRLSTGKSYFPIGLNLGWADAMGTFDFDNWIESCGVAKANWGRVWLSPCWTTFALEQPNMEGRLNLGNAWKLDYVLGLASKNKMFIDLCIDSYNILSSGNNWPEWDRSPYNRKNGGPLDLPNEFWTNASAERMYRNKLRYIVGRWGADPTVFSWEFWNEVDGVTGFQMEPVRNWTQRMSRFLHEIDPYHHLVSTSFGGNGADAGDESVFQLPEIDYSVSHIYDAPDGPPAIASEQTRFLKSKKPHFVAEYGADASGSRAEDDPKGLQLHDALWASIASGSSGGGMLWWWDSYVYPKKLYPLIHAAASFVGDLDWGKSHLNPAQVSVEYCQKPSQYDLVDLSFEGGPCNWSISEFNRPKSISIDGNGSHGGPVAGFQHGIVNHANLHNPISFESDLPRPTNFEALIGDVSGYGGAALLITIDGKVALDESYVVPSSQKGTETLRQYAGIRRFPLSAGRHSIHIENTGQDWVKVDYRFAKAIERKRPPISCLAVQGRDLALIWCRHEEFTWRNQMQKRPLTPIRSACKLVIPNLTPGKWLLEVWDTWTGRVTKSETIVANDKWQCEVALPVLITDYAIKLKLKSPTNR